MLPGACPARCSRKRLIASKVHVEELAELFSLIDRIVRAAQGVIAESNGRSGEHGICYPLRADRRSWTGRAEGVGDISIIRIIIGRRRATADNLSPSRKVQVVLKTHIWRRVYGICVILFLESCHPQNMNKWLSD